MEESMTLLRDVFPEIETEKDLNDLVSKISASYIDNKQDNVNSKIHFYPHESRVIKISESIPFHYFFEHIIQERASFFMEKVSNKDFIKDPTIFCEQTFQNLIDKLWSYSYKLLINIMNSCLLKGENEREKYLYFNEVILNTKNFYISFNKKYSTTIQNLHSLCDSYLSYSEEIINNMEKNYDEINKQFSTEKLISMNIGLGDAHKNGRSTAILEFEDTKLVYKPRKMDIDKSFQYFVKDLNQKFSLNLYTPKILTYEFFGVMEFIEFEKCKNLKEVFNFYTNIGYLMAIVYALNGNDMHYENIIAKRSQPIIIDLESLFLPRIKNKFSKEDKNFNLAMEALEESVNGTAFLPTEIHADDNILDLSGISNTEGEISPYYSDSIKNLGLSNMSYYLTKSKLDATYNTPKIKDLRIDSTKYKEIIWASFNELYLGFMKNKEWLISEIKSIFNDKVIRYIHRSTMLYSKLLQIATYPIFFNNNKYRWMLNHRIGINYNNENISLVRSDIQDLNNFDIPYYTANTTNRNIYWRERCFLADGLDIAPLEKAIKKIESFSKKNLQEQKRIFNLTFLNKSMESGQKTSISFCNETYEEANDKYLLKLYKDKAISIGDYLLDKMISQDDKSCYWIGPSIGLNESDGWEVNVIGADLYNGSTGIAIFFSQLYKVTKEPKYQVASYKILNLVNKHLNEILKHESNEFSPGVFAGCGSYFYALFKCSYYLDDCSLNNDFFDNINLLMKKINHLDSIDADYIYGISSLIHLLANVLKKEEKIEKRNELITYLDFLGKKIQGENISEIKYSGFAHGLAGRLSSYAVLFQATKKRVYLKKANLLLDLLKKYYISEKKEWVNTLEDKDVSYGFCHGSPGILLAMINCKLSSIPINEELLTSTVEHVKNECFGKNMSYCHGDLGNLEIIEKLAILTGDDDLITRKSNTFKQLYNNKIEKIFNPPYSIDFYSLGAMIGITGVGIALLNQILFQYERVDLLGLG